jgi:dTDP-4-amino-4,6-dideoxygalactose transaminase
VRDALRVHLDARGIDTLTHYPLTPLEQDACKQLEALPDAYPNAMALARTQLSLPIGPHLSLDDARHVTEAVNGFRE